MTYKEGLEELRNRYQKGEVSALIGAGFSKNVSKEFPSWYQLLSDMVKELYQSEIVLSFQLYNHFNSLKKSLDVFTENKVKDIIDRDGYLNIVSKYIEHKGIRESVENYIEERIPNVIVDEPNVLLSFGNNGKRIKLEEDDFSIHKKLLEGNWDNIYTTNYDRLLETTAKKYHIRWDTITKSQELSFSKKKKAIIKLHGDLSNNFVFDGNIHQKYIISKEDYLNYPKEHVAFTQLMRISLLQGSFCLIGFSGNDPNFISWINWVRDILVSNNDEEEKKIKVFLIDFSEDIPEPDKSMFYKNNNIFYIPILSKEVKDVIGENKEDSKSILFTLFSYLYKKSNYNDLWKKVYSTNIKKKGNILSTEISINKNVLEEIYSIKLENRIVKNVDKQKYLLDHLFKKQEPFDNSEVELLLLALEDSYFFIDYYPGLTDKLNKQELTDQQSARVKSLQEHEVSLKSPIIDIKFTDDKSKYECILRYAFLLDFTKLKDALMKWNPQGIYRQKKAVFLYLFEKEESKDMLLDYIDSETEINERYYATQLLNLINNTIPSQYPTVQYENQNIEGLYELRKLFLDEIKSKKEEINPYGSGKIIYYGAGNEKYEKSLRFIQFMIEFTTFPCFYIFTVINDKDWYAVFKNIFLIFPYPALFYSIQCNYSKDVLTRIGQDYAYSDVLCKKELPDMLNRMLDAVLNDNTPNFILDNIFEIAKEFLVSVKPNKWEDKFIKIWDKEVDPFYDKIEDYQAISRFTRTALPFLQSKTIKTHIIIDCLSKAKLKREISIVFLYYLKVEKKIIQDNVNLKNAVDAFVRNINTDEDFTIAGNIYNILSERNIVLINSKIRKNIKGNDVKNIAFRAVSHFSKYDVESNKIVKNAILINKRLWDNGIINNGYTTPEYIPLSDYSDVLKWNKLEAISIYAKLKESLEEILNYNHYNDIVNNNLFPMFTIEPLFDEMLTFLIDNKKFLSKQEDYETIYIKLDTEIKKIRRFNDVNEALLSDDSDMVLKGLNQLYTDISLSSIDNYNAQVNLIIDRILFKKTEGLQQCLYYISYYLSKLYTIENLPDATLKKLLYIPQTFTVNILMDMDLKVPENSRYIIKISKCLKDFGENSKGINYWLTIKRNKRYNNI